MVGAYAGNRLGAIRDAKGKSVAAVFSELGGNQKAEVCEAYDHCSDAYVHPFTDPSNSCRQGTRNCCKRDLICLNERHRFVHARISISDRPLDTIIYFVLVVKMKYRRVVGKL